jgi:hypothetical protein
MKYEGFAAVAPPADRIALRLEGTLLWLLAFFLFGLPLVEAPKNIAAGAYLLVWAAHAIRTRSVGGPWNRYDTVFAAVLASAIASSLAGYAGDIAGVVRVFLVGWAIPRSPLQSRASRVLPLAACAGVVLAILIGAVPFLTGAHSFLELPSVGHANQSALYIAIMTAAIFGWWLQGAHGGRSGAMQVWLGFGATLCCAALLAGGSRAAAAAAALAAAAVATGVLLAGERARAMRLLGRAAAIVAALAVLVAALGVLAPHLSDKKLTVDGLLKMESTGTRIRHWNLAVEGWRQHPWLGSGPDSFGQLKIDDVCRWRAQRGEECNRDRYLQQVHAHSVYAATLSERGLVGVLALGMLLSVWAASVWRSRSGAASSWLWPASAASLFIVLVGGTFNTTLRVEHGSIALVWFGLWIAAHGRRRGRG